MQLNQEDREVFILGWCGANRTGKSVEAAKVASSWKEENPTGTVIAYDPQKRFTASVDFEIDRNTKDWAEIVASKTHVLLILDDFKGLYPSNQASAGIMELMNKRAENGIDIIYICHNPGDILEIFGKFTSEYYIFYTNSKDSTIKDKIPNNPTLYIDGVNYMNRYITKFGRTSYPGPFPHVIANIEENTLTAVNFKHIL